MPSFYVEQLSDHHVYIQLTEHIQAVFEQPERTNAIREQIAKTIHPFAFWRADRVFDINGYRFFQDVDKENSFERVICVPEQSSYLELYDRPTFHLVSDDYMQAEAPPMDDSYLDEMKVVESCRWRFAISQRWIFAHIPEPNAESDLSSGESAEFEIFYHPEDYDLPPSKLLFVRAYSRYDDKDLEKYCAHVMNQCILYYWQYTDNWMDLAKKVDYTDDFSGHAIVTIDKYRLIEQIDDFKIYHRIAMKVLVFQDLVVRLIFEDRYVEDLVESDRLMQPVFDSFVVNNHSQNLYIVFDNKNKPRIFVRFPSITHPNSHTKPSLALPVFIFSLFGLMCLSQMSSIWRMYAIGKKWWGLCTLGILGFCRRARCGRIRKNFTESLCLFSFLLIDRLSDAAAFKSCWRRFMRC